ncbi:MAG: helix-turn-helix domain-containing protein [Firmicutes bacterium]|nr:helix-turn-helix domain-containing protein [Bacillota bacterium]
MGVSVSNWIMHRRLEQCRRELVRIGPVRDSITEIAFRWGFNDSAHFSKAFKRLFGLSPRDYQKRHFGDPPKPCADPSSRLPPAAGHRLMTRT